MNFNILVVGESGSGKTTFIKNMLKKFKNCILSSTNLNNNDLLSSKRHFIYSELDKPINEDSIRVAKPTLAFEAYKVKYPYGKQNATYKIIDSPGYGNNIDNNLWIDDVLRYIKKNVLYICNI